MNAGKYKHSFIKSLQKHVCLVADSLMLSLTQHYYVYSTHKNVIYHVVITNIFQDVIHICKCKSVYKIDK